MRLAALVAGHPVSDDFVAIVAEREGATLAVMNAVDLGRVVELAPGEGADVVARRADAVAVQVRELELRPGDAAFGADLDQFEGVARVGRHGIGAAVDEAPDRIREDPVVPREFEPRGAIDKGVEVAERAAGLMTRALPGSGVSPA